MSMTKNCAAFDRHMEEARHEYDHSVELYREMLYLQSTNDPAAKYGRQRFPADDEQREAPGAQHGASKYQVK
jgi:hypothetical protein